MVDTKTQRNKSDKETIIDMEPVKEQQKISFFKTNNFILPLISVLFFVLISTWLILDYLPNLTIITISHRPSSLQFCDKIYETKNLNLELIEK